MSISFIQSLTCDPATSCSICLQPLDTTQTVLTHGDTTEQHQFHKKCLLIWLQHNPTCPICRCPVTNVRELISCGKKVQVCANRIKQALQNHPIAAAASTVPVSLGLGMSLGWLIGSDLGLMIGWLCGTGVSMTALLGATLVSLVRVRNRQNRRANQVYVITQSSPPHSTLAPIAVQPTTPCIAWNV